MSKLIVRRPFDVSSWYFPFKILLNGEQRSEIKNNSEKEFFLEGGEYFLRFDMYGCGGGRRIFLSENETKIVVVKTNHLVPALSFLIFTFFLLLIFKSTVFGMRPENERIVRYSCVFALVLLSIYSRTFGKNNFCKIEELTP